MEFNKIMLLSVILFVSMTTVFSNTIFRISKFNMCPPEDFKFLSLVNLSLEKCSDECYRRKHCYAVGFKRLYNLCELYTTFTSTSSSRGKCVIVNKDDIQGQTTNTAEQVNDCEEFEGEVSQSNGTNVTCSKHAVCSSVVAQMTRLSCSHSQIQIFTKPLSKPNASAACKEIEGKLAKVDKEWKFDAIETLLRDCPGLAAGQYWVDGYTERNKIDAWTFSDGTLVPMSKHFWKNNAPNDQDENVPKCVRMVRHSNDKIGDHRFDDRDCFYEFGYICEQN